jgi:hypothetical protein
MVTMPDETQDNQRAQALQHAGEQKFGADTFQRMIDSVGRAGVPTDALRQIVYSPTALQDFTALSQEGLLREMANAPSTKKSEYRMLESTYTSIRDTQKADHSKGRR